MAKLPGAILADTTTPMPAELNLGLMPGLGIGLNFDALDIKFLWLFIVLRSYRRCPDPGDAKRVVARTWAGRQAGVTGLMTKTIADGEGPGDTSGYVF